MSHYSNWRNDYGSSFAAVEHGQVLFANGGLMKRLLTLALLCALAPATTYYVAKTGSNGNPGTFASPWLTIAHSSGVVAAGDTVYVETGTYSEGVLSFDGSSGTAANRIVISNYQTQTVTILGAIGIYRRHYVIQGFHVTLDSVTYANNTQISAIAFHDISAVYPDSCVVRNCEATCFKSGYCAGSSGILFNDWEVCESVIGCRCHGFGATGTGNQGHGIYTIARDCVILHDTCYGNTGVGIHEYFQAGQQATNRNTIAYNVCYGSVDGHSGIIVKGDTNNVHDNLTYNNTGPGLIWVL